MAYTIFMPPITLPKTTCLPSSEPFAFGAALAMHKMPRPVCFRMKFSSSNFSPKIDLLPVLLLAHESCNNSVKAGTFITLVILSLQCSEHEKSFCCPWYFVRKILRGVMAQGLAINGMWKNMISSRQVLRAAVSSKP
jgi:hypothetical protein